MPRGLFPVEYPFPFAPSQSRQAPQPWLPHPAAGRDGGVPPPCEINVRAWPPGAVISIKKAPPTRPPAKVARYRRERTAKERERPAQNPPAGSSSASDFLHTLSCGLHRGRATFADQNGTVANQLLRFLRRPLGLGLQRGDFLLQFHLLCGDDLTGHRFVRLSRLEDHNGGALPPGAHANGSRKPRPRKDGPTFLGIKLSPPILMRPASRPRHLAGQFRDVSTSHW